MAFRTNKTPVLQEKSASGSVATFNTALAMPLAECKAEFSASVDGVSEINISQFGNIANISHDNESRVINPQYFTLTYTGHNSVTFTPTLVGSLGVIWNLIYVTSNMIGKTLYLNMDSNNASYWLVKSDSIDYSTNIRVSPINFTSYTITNADLNKYIGFYIGNSTGNPSSLSNVMISFAEANYQDYYTPITYNIPFNNTYYDGGVVDIVNGVVYPINDTPESLSVPTLSTIIGNNSFASDSGSIELKYKDLDLAKRGNFREVFKLPS